MALKIKGVDLGALLAGVGVYVLGSVITGFAIGIALRLSGMDAAEGAVFMKSGGMLCLSLVLGAAILGAGGYSAARIARRRYRLHGIAVGIVCFLIALPLLAAYPLWFRIIALLAPLPCATAGAYLARKH
ncbi:MAG: hypothetical protein M3N08_07895 [Pseudomonadota bacterium]|nr:hypothetical protein [Pseudomonadota bacterium]